MIEISINNGFERFDCNNGISSEVFHKEGEIYKVSTRNSIKRVFDDFADLQRTLYYFGFQDKIQASEIFSCRNSEGDEAVCVKQKRIDGNTIAELGKDGLLKYLKERPDEIDFLKKLIELFHDRIQAKKLYPDLVGNPSDQSLWNSINLMIDKRGIVICDIGLSPHETTLKKYGENFFYSENVAHYKQRMREAISFLNSI